MGRVPHARSLAAPAVVSACLGLVACHEKSNGVEVNVPAASNLGLAIAGMTGNEDLWLLSVSEADQGGTDLNGDGDALDRVLHVLDLATDQVTNTSLDVTPSPQGELWRVEGTLVAFAVSESGQ